MASGNGSDNAHNNQFGGGERGPTGGVNMGSSSSSGGNNDRGNGMWVMSNNPEQGETKWTADKGAVISITNGMNWVEDNRIHWSDGKADSNDSRDNLLTNATQKIKSGYRAAVDGFIYTVTVNGNDSITSINLYSRPVDSSRNNWSKGEAVRKESARFLVQEQLDAKNRSAQAEAKKVADALAAAEEKRKAEEEAKRKQAEWDAAHPVEAAERDSKNASAALNSANSATNNSRSQISRNNTAINNKNTEVNQLNNEISPRLEKWRQMQRGGAGAQAQQFYGAQIDGRVKKRDALTKEIAALNSQNNSLNNALNQQTKAASQAQAALSSAQGRLAAARAEAERKRLQEARRQAEEAARLKAQQEAEALRQAQAAAKAKEEAEASTKAAALEAAMSRLEEPNTFAVKALAASMAAALSPMSFAETGLGSITFTSEAAALAWSSVKSVIAELLAVSPVGAAVAATIASIFYVPGAGEGSGNVPGLKNINMFATVMDPDALNLPDEQALKAALAHGKPIESMIRGRVYFDDNTFRTELIRTLTPTTIRVVKAVRDEITGLYGYTLPAEDGLPSRTILISPQDVPGAGGLPPLITPVVTEIGGTHTGNEDSLTQSPNIESYPLSDEPDFNDFILVFEELKLKPIYVMFQDGLDDGRYTRKQLDRKFKHASDFGINETRKNRETLSRFRGAIEQHLADPKTIERGTYITSEESKVYFNEGTLNVVVLDKEGMFLSGWKLDPNSPVKQYENYINKGILR